MLKFGNKEFRNIQEQVAKNMNDIDWLINYKGAINEFGIKVVGQGPKFEAGTPDVSSYNPGDVICAWADGLGEYLVYFCAINEAEEKYWTRTIDVYKEYHEGWEYGDAWIFGNEAPYEMFILTRSNGSNPNDYFLNVGEFPIPGPQGEQGEQGPVGGTPNVTMTTGSVSTLNPGQSATATISKSGTLTDPVFTISFGIPQGAKGNAGNTGPQGPVGPKGDKGDKGDKGETGGLIEIVGIVATAGDLPDPVELDKLDDAYLVGTSPNYDLYIQVGETPSTAIWTNIGTFNKGTLVLENGEGVPTFNADTKINVYNEGLVNTIYAQVAGSGNGQYHLPYGTGATANLIVQRDSNGQIIVPENPSVNTNATSKKYVDDKIAAQNPLQYKGDIIVGDAGGVPERLALGSAGQVLSVNSNANGLEYKTINGVPAYESTDADKALKVNSLGTGLEWGEAGGGSDYWVEHGDGTSDKILYYNPVVSSSATKHFAIQRSYTGNFAWIGSYQAGSSISSILDFNLGTNNLTGIRANSGAGSAGSILGKNSSNVLSWVSLYRHNIIIRETDGNICSLTIYNEDYSTINSSSSLTSYLNNYGYTSNTKLLTINNYHKVNTGTNDVLSGIGIYYDSANSAIKVLQYSATSGEVEGTLSINTITDTAVRIKN